MNIQLLSVSEFYFEKFAPGSSEALGKAASFGLPFSLFGFAVVFGVLAIIMLVVMAFGRILGFSNNKPEVKKTEKIVEIKSEPVPVVKTTQVSDDGNIVAAIMAAISAFRGANGEKGGFRVVSFKKRK